MLNEKHRKQRTRLLIQFRKIAMKRPEVWKLDLGKGIQQNQKLGDRVLTNFIEN